jgi:hypothetical protein
MGWKKQYTKIIGILVISNLFAYALSDIEVVSRITSILNLLAMYYTFKLSDNTAKYIVVFYLIAHGLFFTFFGLTENPEIFFQSETFWNGKLL